jgi:hypothetical protein
MGAARAGPLGRDRRDERSAVLAHAAREERRRATLARRERPRSRGRCHGAPRVGDRVTRYEWPSPVPEHARAQCGRGESRTGGHALPTLTVWPCVAPASIGARRACAGRCARSALPVLLLAVPLRLWHGLGLRRRVLPCPAMSRLRSPCPAWDWPLPRAGMPCHEADGAGGYPSVPACAYSPALPCPCPDLEK